MHCSNCGHQLVPGVKFCSKCGAPVAQPAAYVPPIAAMPPPGQMQASWNANPQAATAPPQRKSRVGKVLLILFAVFVLGIAGVGVAGYYGFRYVEGSLKSSDAYRMAEGELHKKAAGDSLGEIKSTGFPIGSFKEEGDGSGAAAFTMSVEGTKASGQYFVVMQREDRVWRIERAVVKLADGSVVNLVESKETSIPYEQHDGINLNVNSGITSPGGKIVSSGWLNGKAISKPDPAYPAVAKAAHASGTVVLQLVVDEKGNVISVSVVSGHPLLQASAVTAARQVKFTPTLIAGKPVKVSGVLTYDFKPE